MYLRRKIDNFLENWKNRNDKMPLIIKGARQIGKTESIEEFGKSYTSFVKINFVLQEDYKTIFDNGYNVDKILKNITLINPSFKFIPHKTLIFFDEFQSCIKCATSLKAFRLDGRFDVICSGSLMGINYNEIESNSVGNKEDIEMYPMDFEEFLWAKGYTDEQIDDMYICLKETKPLGSVTMKVMEENFREFLVLGGMPNVVKTFVQNKNFSGTLKMQRQLLLDYEEDITKYAQGLDKGKILSFYRKIPVFLGKDNKKFQISKIRVGAKNRDFVGIKDWLDDAGIALVCHSLIFPSLPLGGNFQPDNYKLYFGDEGLLIASLDDEAQEDLRVNKNFNTYKGAIFENVVANELKKQGYDLYFYRNEKGTIEMDFFIRDADSLIPVEVKAGDNATKSLKKLIESPDYPDIKYGIKLCNKNIGKNENFYTIPYFLTFMLKRWIMEKIANKNKE